VREKKLWLEDENNSDKTEDGEAETDFIESPLN
jgi:hypothetical protein